MNLNNIFPNEWQDSFAFLKELTNSIHEITRPALEGLQRIQEIVHPIVEAVERYKPGLIMVGQVMVEAFRRLSAIEKLGEAQFVCWDYLSTEYVDTILESKNLNKALREEMVRNRFQKANETIDKTLSSPVIKKRQRLYSQAVTSFRNGDCDLAVTGFTSVIDGLLADISKNTTSQLKPRIEVIMDKLNKNEVLEHHEFALLSLSITFEKAIISFSEFSDFTKPEPKKLNRNWIAHGRSGKKRTKLDCVKLINLIYGLLLIEELDTKNTPQEKCEQGD